MSRASVERDARSVERPSDSYAWQLSEIYERSTVGKEEDWVIGLDFGLSATQVRDVIREERHHRERMGAI